MTPNGITAAPSRVTIPGMIVCIGRLNGPMQFGWSRSQAKTEAAIV